MIGSFNGLTTHEWLIHKELMINGLVWFSIKYCLSTVQKARNDERIKLINDQSMVYQWLLNGSFMVGEQSSKILITLERAVNNVHR